MRPQDSREVLGLFLLVQRGRNEMEDPARHYLANGSETAPDAREAIEWAGETRATMVDLKFCDLLGTWQHVTLPLTAFDESAFDDGLGFDGSSIRGWQAIQDSDMLLLPDPRPGHGGADSLARLRDRRPHLARAVREGPARRREARRGAPARERDR